MMRAVIAMGAGGGRLLESLVWAACTCALTAPELALVWIEPDESLPEVKGLLVDYEALRQLMPSAQGTRGFRTAFTLETWKVPDGSAAHMGGDALRQTLLDRQEAAASWRSRADRHMNLAALAYGASLDDAPWLQRLQRSDAEIILCGDISDCWCATGMVQLAQRMPSACGVVLLPHTPAKPEGLAAARETLRMLAEHPLQALYLLGMPEGYYTEKKGAHLLHWLGALAVEALCSDDRRGVYTMGAQANRFVWADFGLRSAVIRRGYTGLMRASALLLTEIATTLQDRLGAKPKLTQRRISWYSTFFRQSHRLDEAALTALRDQVESLRSLAVRYVRWTLEVVASLPPQWQDQAAHAEAERQMAEHYRLLLDAAGELALMDEEISRSGMDKEQLVRRGAPKETAADELLRRAEAQRATVQRLEQEQQALDRVAGGTAKRQLMTRMLQGIDRALAAEERRTAAWREAAEEKVGDSLRIQEGVYRLETHMRILRAERARVVADQAQQKVCAPPHLTTVRPWGNDLFDPELLSLLAQYLTTDDDKQKRLLAASLQERAELGDVLLALGRGAPGDAPVGGLLARLLELATEGVGE